MDRASKKRSDMTLRLRHILFVAATILSVNCFTGEGSSGRGSSTEVSTCKNACNQLKFFACNDDVDHASCFQNCDAASSSQIVVFDECVSADICDPACSTHIRSNDPPDPVPSENCTQECAAFFADSCVPDGTDADCAQVCDEDPGLATYCFGKRTACELPAQCSLGSSPTDDCKAACQSQEFFDCISPADAGQCAALCKSVPAETVEQFTLCASSGICDDDSCYKILNPAGGSADVTGCRETCSDMNFFDCIDTSQLSLCHTLCASASSVSIESFKTCNEGFCSDDGCFVVFQGAS